MAWTTPKTWVAGSQLTAAEFNTHLRDNLDWLKAALSTHGITSDTTIGDLKGAAYSVVVERTTTQSINNATDTVVLFPTEIKDTDAFHSTITNTGRLTVPSGGDGDYICGYGMEFASASTGHRGGYVEENGTTGLLQGATRQPAVSGSPSRVTGVAYWPDATAGDYVQLICRHSQGTSLNLNEAVFWMYRLFAS